jgi:CHAT domain-containing protein
MEHTGLTHETLAAFREGRLDPETRRQVIEHMSVCSECDSVVLVSRRASHQRQGRSTRRISLKRSLAFVAAIALLAGASMLYARWARSESRRIAILASAAPLRVYEGRIAGFPYRPLAPKPMRGPSEKTPIIENSLSHEFLLAVSEAISQADKSPADYHVSGVVALISGRHDNAVAALERSLTLATGIRDAQAAADVSTDDALLTDISTAYLNRGISKRQASDYVRALECADRAWSLRQTPETGWNRAMSLQQLHLNDDAKEAWQTYLRKEAASQWIAEAHERLEETEGSSEWKVWLRDGKRILELSAPETERLVLLFPLQTRKAAENEMLPAWGRAVVSGNFENAAAFLKQLEVIGAALEKHSGEAFLADVSANLRAWYANASARNELAHALVTIGEAKSACDGGNGKECSAKLGSVIPTLRRYRSPLVEYARFYSAASHYLDNDFASLRGEAARLADIPDRYKALHAQTKWIVGLGELSTGRPENALPHYEAALAEFTQLGESDFVAAVHVLLAEAYDYLDSPDDAWTQRERALELVSRIGPISQQRVQLLQGCAQLLLANHRPLVAKILLDRTLKLPDAADPLFFVEANSWRAVALQQLGRGAEAEAAWKLAADAAGKIRVSGIRDRARNDVTLTRALALENGLTAADLDEGVAFARNGDNRWAIPRMLRLRADVDARRGAYEQAMRGYLATIDEIVDQRQKTSPARYELLNRACLSDATEHAVSLAVSRGDYDSAFRFSEHSAGAAFPEGRSTALPAVAQNVAVVKIVCLPDRMLVWTITAHGAYKHQVPATLEAVRGASEELAGGADTDVAARLGRMIINPSAIGRNVDTLVFVPDAAVAVLPFEQLIDPATGKPLLERYVIAESHTVASYLRAAASGASTNASAPLLVDGAQAADMPTLPEAKEEIRALQRLYPSATLWNADSRPIDSLPSALESAGLIHFAAHGVVNRANELLSNIVLGKRNEVLYAHEVEALQLSRHPIVVLSICSGASTATSRRRRAPTLADAFLAAGASVVVATSERIDDDRARRFSLLLHERLERGMPVGRAVREIQLRFARDGQTWSDLLIVGNPAATLRSNRKAPPAS